MSLKVKKVRSCKHPQLDRLTNLCGTTTNIWLSPVEEDLSMTACFEHSASNL
jgi:hypothetical protein